MAFTERRIVQVGNSLGLTLPIEVPEELNIKKGDKVQVELVGNQLVIKKAPETIAQLDGIPPDFCTILKEEMETHHEALKGLVDR
ncbi:AbrB/MazE/SpoVT family DNA-binding domain-containing protein [Planococcus lenghuensis]|uniref:SpoVT-AbrB domain-containing protein n=1 Tax=Planococcus lenghuensis TaxID=2213202 RepID=A0A1Q2L2K0_9BACL|nr:AbrB/MazE/SpoVT family DNA-binding domain-containing protein [Planococcus lenghuensis]AQQ54112.1 hypothetical protein B0X71_14030 [Planococcus lenghuensis]